MTMKKRNKKYNPNKHRVAANSVFRTVQLAKPVTDESKAKLNEQIHAALTAITKGVGTTLHFDVLASTVDVVFMMAMNLFDNAYEVEIDQARRAMFRLKDRYHKTEKFGFDGEGYNAIKQLVMIHDEMMNQVTGAEVLQFMHARANAIKGGNYYKGNERKAA
jgi:hypothetical protein